MLSEVSNSTTALQMIKKSPKDSEAPVVSIISKHAIADEVQLVSMEDAGGNEVLDILFSPDDNGMAGVVSALVAGDQVHVSGEVVDDFAFSFIAPLAAK